MRAELSENPPQTIFEIPTNKLKKSNRFTEISRARINREILRLAKPNFPKNRVKTDLRLITPLILPSIPCYPFQNWHHLLRDGTYSIVNQNPKFPVECLYIGAQREAVEAGQWSRQ